MLIIKNSSFSQKKKIKAIGNIMKKKMKSLLLINMTVLLSLLIFSGCSGKNEQVQDNSDDQSESLIQCVEFESKEMEYFRFGNKDGRKIIILPGVALKSVMSSAEAVISAYDILAKDYDVYLFDHIKVEPESYSVEQMTDDTVKVLNKLGLDHVNIIGISLGGMIGEVMAIKYPEMVESLVLCSASANIKDKGLFEDWIKYAEERNVEKLMISFGENIYTPEIYEQFKDAILASGEGASDLDYENFIAANKAIINFNVEDELEQIKCPVYILGAGEDKVVGVQASLDMAEKLKCDYYIYEGCGHGVYDEAADYKERIKSFLDNN